MASMNSVTLIGNLAAPPEQFKGGCRFRIATNESYTDKQGEFVEATEWHAIAAFGNVAESCLRYLTKGSQVCVQGKLKTSEYYRDEADSNAKKSSFSTSIIARSVLFLTPKKQPSPPSSVEESETEEEPEAVEETPAPAQRKTGFSGKPAPVSKTVAVAKAKNLTKKNGRSGVPF